MTSTRLRAACAAACLVIVAEIHAEDVAAPKTGSFELTFADRSPLSDPKTLATRLRLATPADDYDLNTMPFLVYVPEAYDAKRPIGVVVWMNYKESTTLPTTVLSQFADANCALIVARLRPEELATRVGLAVDAAHNMAARYAVDPRRIYVFGGAEGGAADGKFVDSALTAGLSFADVFTGTMTVGFGYYHVIKEPDRTTWQPTLAAPDLSSLVLARQHPLVLAKDGDQPYYDRCVAAFKADGFKHVDVMSIALDTQYHYPNLAKDWIPGVLKFMDAATTATTKPTTRPTTRATTRPTIAHVPLAPHPPTPRPAHPSPAPRPPTHASR